MKQLQTSVSTTLTMQRYLVSSYQIQQRLVGNLPTFNKKQHCAHTPLDRLHCRPCCCRCGNKQLYSQQLCPDLSIYVCIYSSRAGRSAPAKNQKRLPTCYYYCLNYTLGCIHVDLDPRVKNIKLINIAYVYRGRRFPVSELVLQSLSFSLPSLAVVVSSAPRRLSAWSVAETTHNTHHLRLLSMCAATLVSRCDFDTSDDQYRNRYSWAAIIIIFIHHELWNNLEIIWVFYFIRNRRQWLRVK